jgi:hypothetical protein
LSLGCFFTGEIAEGFPLFLLSFFFILPLHLSFFFPCLSVSLSLFVEE